MSIQLYTEVEELALRMSAHQQFYCMHIDERCTMNGSLHRNEKKNYLHVAIKKGEGEFEFRIEYFDAILKNRHLSTSEKEYLLQLDAIQNELTLTTNRFAEIRQIDNLSVLQIRAQKTIQKLAKNYIGGNALNTFQHLRNYYKHPQLILADLVQYNRLGLLFSKFYGNVKNGVNKKYLVRYNNFLPHTLVQVNETIVSYRIQYEAGQTLVSYKGVLDADFIQRAAFERQLNLEHLPFTNHDHPTLNHYNGSVVFENTTGTVQQADLLIDFSFGAAYHKTIEYSLKAIDAQDVP